MSHEELHRMEEMGKGEVAPFIQNEATGEGQHDYIS